MSKVNTIKATLRRMRVKGAKPEEVFQYAYTGTSTLTAREKVQVFADPEWKAWVEAYRRKIRERGTSR